MIVYGLIDPRTKMIRYVGKSVRTAHRRLRRHLAESYLRGDTHKERWIRQLLKQGLEPQIIVLQTCNSEEELSSAEQQHIAQFRADGISLTNLTDGGEGMTGWKHTAISKAKLSAALKGRVRTDEHRRHIAEANLGRKASEETRAKLRSINARPRRPLTDQWRQNISKGKGGSPFVDQYHNHYPTIKGAARDLGLSPGHICEVLHGKRNHAGGYKFYFLPRSQVREFPGIAP